MRRIRVTIALLATTAAAVVLSACGGGGDAAVTVPDAPGAPLAARVLGEEELGIAGYAAAGSEVTPKDPETFLSGECTTERERALQVLDANGVEAVARRSFTAPEGAALSNVWQFSTPAGARAWQEEVVRQSAHPAPECVPDGVTRTAFDTHPVEGLPDGEAMRIAQTADDGPAEAWNVLFTDGRFAYVVGAVGPPGTVTEEAVVSAARRQWARRDG